ncbi:MAG TPA: hypothetical protein VMH30_04005 [Verrucomicrobiae bacterium]|nr:hypothetical protein [Verrucomicrobiae bacterium]
MNKIKPKALTPLTPCEINKTVNAPFSEPLAHATVLKNRTVMVLEDNEDLVRKFERAVAALGSQFKLRLWRDAPTMKAQCGNALAETCLISLDHDLVPLNNRLPDPGTGLEVAEFLSRHKPVCPVILHTNHERRWSMHNEFRFAGWNVEIVPPIGDDWIQNSWLLKVRALIGL